MKSHLTLLSILIAGFAHAQDLTPLSDLMKTAWPKNRAIQVVFHGHSVPAGFHKTPEVKTFESYPHLVHVKLKEQYPLAIINVITTAIGGENSIPGAARFERDVLSLKPDIIFIDYALNDRRQPDEKVEAAWLAMITAAKNTKVPVVLLTPTGDSSAKLDDPKDPLNLRAELIRKIAKDQGVLIADVFAAWKAEIEKGTPQTEILSQVNHPNLKGHTLAAETIFKALVEAGLKK
ncbi:MAG: SGNH/GDSL hydrolase family protein [Akkermansiaceae bacterium]|jgi:acyl-CoA thioesterase-1|nr:GDSL-type esterase/lipase family protein [Luteolibacter sp.]